MINESKTKHVSPIWIRSPTQKGRKKLTPYASSKYKRRQSSSPLGWGKVRKTPSPVRKVLSLRSRSRSRSEPFFQRLSSKVGGAIDHDLPDIDGSNKEKLSQKSVKFMSLQLSGTIGNGNFGKVLVGVNADAKESVAVKFFNKFLVRDTCEVEHMHQEVMNMKECHHNNIVSFINVMQDDKYFCIVMEYLSGGDLRTTIKKYKSLEESDVQVIVKDISEGLNYLHHKNIIFYDLKPANVMFKANGSCALVDLGLSYKLNEQSTKKMPSSILGTPAYMSPEIIKRSIESDTFHASDIDKASDLWALGVLCYYAIEGTYPFTCKESESEHESMKYMFVEILKRRFNPLQNGSDHCTSFINGLFAMNPHKRLGYMNSQDKNNNCLTHPFLLFDHHKLSRDIIKSINLSPNDINQNDLSFDLKKRSRQKPTRLNMFNSNDSLKELEMLANK